MFFKAKKNINPFETPEIISGETYRVKFYASDFGSIDRASDRMLKGSFIRTIEQYKKHPVMLYGHNYEKPIGVISDISEDEKGLLCSIDVTAERYGLEYIKDIENGVITHSFGYDYVDFNWNDFEKCFDVRDVELYEISAEACPCNVNARVISVEKI